MEEKKDDLENELEQSTSDSISKSLVSESLLKDGFVHNLSQRNDTSSKVKQLILNQNKAVNMAIESTCQIYEAINTE
ncbi:hypothetical protein [Absicoccus porci]|uniref:hypothetical protein n=1 Tax=Absicoccus porci TaxID=2486576 RepID=UPI00294298B2|nr:hypothetical protein [Absicoccus porci]